MNKVINKNPGLGAGFLFITLPPERQTIALRQSGRLVPMMMAQYSNNIHIQGFAG
ncbi:hypothetical protein [Rheinheimera sp. EpRS3]|uniref:hypothetical protein n=1 Tax=Rheinheimera sp. EpRS3 TaxID=1712383 RepID=UPI000B1E7BB7|nr:hypothetical protein [Rheinheimera sp. EpRS3]